MGRARRKVAGGIKFAVTGLARFYGDLGKKWLEWQGKGVGWAKRGMKKLAGAVPGIFQNILKNYTDIGRFAIGRTRKVLGGIGKYAVGMFSNIRRMFWDKKDEAVDTVKGAFAGMLRGTGKIFGNILDR